MTERKPNILLIVTDQQRWDSIGCLYSTVDTPHLDLLVSEGIAFTNCITNSPICMPARVALATGRYPHNFGLWKNGGFQLSPNSPTWMKAIRDQGYRTSLFGKVHLHLRHKNDLRVDEPLLHAYGFDDVNEIVGPRASARTMSHMTALWQERGLWEAYRKDFRERFETKPHLARPSTLPLDLYYDVYVPQQAKEYLASYERSEPWFCMIGFGGPHEPWDAPEPYASRYQPSQMPPAVPSIRLMPDDPKSTLRQRFQIAGKLDPGEVAELRANYAGSITLIDEQIGEVIDCVKARGEWDNTVVVFTSDHGEMNGDHGLLYKNTFLNGAVRVPLIVRTPDTARQPHKLVRCESIVELMDVGATLADIAGAELNYNQFGKSLTSLLAGGNQQHRDSALSVFKGEFMLQTPDFRLAVNRHGEPYLLIDLKNDPEEQCNLIRNAHYKSVLTELCVSLMARLVSAQNYTPGMGAGLPPFVRN
jgi:choline-sulfatase